MKQFQPFPSSASRDLLCSHLCHQVEGGKAGVNKVLLVPSHFDGVQPVSHSGEGGVIWDSAVQEWLRDAKGQESHRSQGAGNKKVNWNQGRFLTRALPHSSYNHPSFLGLGKSWLEAAVPLTQTGRWQ